MEKEARSAAPRWIGRVGIGSLLALTVLIAGEQLAGREGMLWFLASECREQVEALEEWHKDGPLNLVRWQAFADIAFAVCYALFGWVSLSRWFRRLPEPVVFVGLQRVLRLWGPRMPLVLASVDLVENVWFWLVAEKFVGFGGLAYVTALKNLLILLTVEALIATPLCGWFMRGRWTNVGFRRRVLGLSLLVLVLAGVWGWRSPDGDVSAWERTASAVVASLIAGLAVIQGMLLIASGYFGWIVRYLVLTRLSWLGGVALIVAPFVMAGNSIAMNMTLIESVHGLFFVGVSAGLAATAVVTTLLLTLQAGGDRIGLAVPKEIRALLPSGDALHPRRLLFIVLLTAPIAMHTVYDEPGSILATASPLMVYVGAATIALTTRLVQRRGGRRFGLWARGVFERRLPIPGWASGATAGYVERDHIRPAHVSAALATLVLIGVYAILRIQDEGSGFVAGIPAVFGVWYLVALIVTFGAGAAFFLDRWRLPLIVSIVVGTVALDALSDSYHRLPTKAPSKAATPSARDALDQRLAHLSPAIDKPEKVVIICAAGGGIQSAAWTVRVLRELLFGPNALDGLANHIHLLTGVSGGSVGLAFYGAAAREGQLTSKEAWDDLEAAVQGNGLNALSWALTFRDVSRPFSFGFGNEVDRGTALEAAWNRNLTDHQIPSAGTLGDWSVRAADGSMPAFVFNSTVAGVGAMPQNKGLRLMFGSVRLKAAPDRFVDFGTLAGKDINVLTAARASASFPWAAPMAQFDVGRSRIGVADGGYFENYGLTTALEWALDVDPDGKREFAIVQLLPFPDLEAQAAARAQEEAKECPPDKKDEATRPNGWATTVLGPIDLLLSTWGRGQLARGSLDRRIIEALDEGRFSFYRFQTGLEKEPPLSWRLSKSEKKAIAEGWNNSKHNAEQREALQVFLRRE